MKRHMEFQIGAKQFLSHGRVVPITVSTETAVNPHILVVGTSGAGKSVLIRDVVTAFAEQTSILPEAAQTRLHLMDTQGDLISQDCFNPIPQHLLHTYKFIDDAEYGFNPLAINPNPEFGGVRRRIESFVTLINQTTHAMGVNQQEMLTRLLEDLYKANGYYIQDKESWKPKPNRRQVNIFDLQKFVDYKARTLFLGGNAKVMAKYGAHQATLRKLRKFIKEVEKHGESGRANLEDAKKAFDNAKADCIESFTDFINGMETGHEFDEIYNYGTEGALLKSISNRIRQLVFMGIFKAENPQFSRRCPVWGYDVVSMAQSDDELRLFTFSRINSIFDYAVQRGLSDHIRDYIVLDEAHKFYDKDPKNPVGKVAREGRKYGVGLILASQQPKHFTDDIIKCFGSKIIIGADESDWKHLQSQFMVPAKYLPYIVLNKTACVMTKSKGIKNDWVSIVLNRAMNDPKFAPKEYKAS